MAIVIIATLNLVLVAMNVRNRKYKYMFGFNMIGWIQIAGYSMRIVVINSPQVDKATLKSNVLLSQIFLLLSPNILVLFTFRVVLELLGKLEFDRKWAKTLKIIFIVYYIISFGVQINGIIDIFSDDLTLQAQGRKYVLAGTVIQLVFFTFFVGFMSQVQLKSKNVQGLLPMFIAFYIQIGCLFTRAAFRIASFASTSTDDVNSHEYYVYLFDFMMIATMFLTYSVLHYPRYLDRTSKVQPSKDV